MPHRSLTCSSWHRGEMRTYEGRNSSGALEPLMKAPSSCHAGCICSQISLACQGPNYSEGEHLRRRAACFPRLNDALLRRDAHSTRVFSFAGRKDEILTDWARTTDAKSVAAAIDFMAKV